MPAIIEPPLSWGSEDHVREIFAGAGVTLEFDRESVPLSGADGAAAGIEWASHNFGPLIMLRGRLGQIGQMGGGSGADDIALRPGCRMRVPRRDRTEGLRHACGLLAD